MLSRKLFRPGTDPGLLYEAAPAQIMRPVRAAKVRQIPACDNDDANRYILRRIEPRWRWPAAPPVFQLAASLVVLNNAEYRGNSVRVGGKYLLSGAAGNRVWARHAGKYSEQELAIQAGVIDALREDSLIRVRGSDKPVPDSVPFAVDLRNGYNFYHFLTEGMPQLAVIARADSPAPIHVHMPRLDDLKGFVRAFIETIYPQLSGRIVFTDQKVTYEMVRAVYQHRHYLYQVADPSVAAMIAATPKDDPWRELSAATRSRGFVAKNTLDDGQALLAQDVRALIETAPRRDWPERVLIMRDPARGARDRKNQREKRFEKAMRDLGFETMYLERLAPLEQMALWAGAKMIVSPHGAAFAHMMFVTPDCEVIEIGTPQTQTHRWGDFLQNAHVARCKYTTIYSDVSRAGIDDDRIAPSMSQGLLGIRFSDRLIDVIEDRAVNG